MKKLEKKINIMRKCKICEIGNVEGDYYICNYCGWESDPLQEENEDYIGGANHMSLNQYKKFWKENKEQILKADNTCFKAIDLAKKYYEINYKNHKLN